VRRIFLFGFIQLIFLAACGGGVGLLNGNGGSSSGGGGSSGSGQTIASAGPNVVAVTVDGGPAGVQAGTVFNIPYVSVTICAPGSTTNCQTIDHVEVDTGSYGLRIIASVLNSSLLSALPPEAASVGGTLAECTQFGDGIAWGSMRTADVVMSSEKGSSVPLQVIGDPNFPNIPSDCTSHGSPEDTVALFGANGIIGVGPFVQDCGDFCAGSTQGNVYFACASSTACNDVDTPVNLQASNPVAYFTTDKNGIILELAPVPDAGATTASGALVFGIDTQSNNTSSAATVFTTDDVGDISITYNGVNYPDSFLDSGSNFTFFNDGSIAVCGTAPNTYFCPSAELNLSATVEGANNAEKTVTFNVMNLANFSNALTALDNVAAPANAFADTGSGNQQSETFDFGLPFYYGRNIFVAIGGDNTSSGEGPYFAF
jgi:Protein of unknown function (DUF3443)